MVASTNTAGLQKVKEEAGTTAASLLAMSATVSKTNVIPQQKLVLPVAALAPGAAGIPQPTAAAATALASMFSSFPGAFNNAAAFAAAAAAAFPPGLPKLARAKCLVPIAASAASATDKPATKRRKRGRAPDDGTDTGPDLAKPEGLKGAGGRACSVGDVIISGGMMVSKAGRDVGEGPSPAKLRQQHPRGAISPHGSQETAGWARAAGAGAGGSAGTPPINVITPNLFGAEMSNQERKERRKIRNRMSAQQHRERQRQRVDTLEDCLRLRDDEIARLLKQVASLTERNQKLTERVQQLESGECPDLDDVLKAIGGTDELQLQQHQHQQPVLQNAFSSPACSPPSATGGDTMTTSSFCCGHAAAAAAAASASANVGISTTADGKCKGGGGYTSDGGGMTTEDLAHSSSESDSEDLSPISTQENRSDQPGTPPLSPVSARADNPAAGITAVGSFAGGEAAGELVEFSLSDLMATETEGVSMTMDGAPSWTSAPGGGLARSFSRVAADVANSTAAGDGCGREVGVAGASDGGIACEDDLTMAALDPMEIDALLACAGDDGDVCASDPFDIDIIGGHGGQGAADDGCTSPSELEAGNSYPTGSTGVALSSSSHFSSSQTQQHDDAGRRPRASQSRTAGPYSQPSRASSPPGTAASGVAARARGGGVGAALPSGEGGRGGRHTGGASGGIASTLAVGVMGAMCLAGLVINSGTLGGGGRSSSALVVTQKNLPPSVVSSRGGGGRVLSGQDGGDEDGGYVNATRSEPWVLDPVEAEPWRWRTTAARERRGPWVWQRALNLFGNAGFGADRPRGSGHTDCNEDVVGVYNTAMAKPSYPPIAPPPSAVPPNKPQGHQGHRQALQGRSVDEELMGKELDLFFDGGHSSSAGFSRASPSGGGGGGRGGRARQGPSPGGGTAGLNPGGLPAERTSYVFCPEAHGMMSGGMIEHASKAMYDHHHPGARPCPASHGGSSGGEEEGAQFHRSGEFKVNVIDSLQLEQQERLRILAGEPPVQSPDQAAKAAADAFALVSSSSRTNMQITFDGDVYFDSAGEEGEKALGGGGVTSTRPRRRGPTPIHPGSSGGPERVFHRDVLQPLSGDAEFLTMLVPSDALDWGPSTLALRAALNGTNDDQTAAGGGGAGGSTSWVEIDCQILNARLVEGVTFSG